MIRVHGITPERRRPGLYNTIKPLWYFLHVAYVDIVKSINGKKQG